MIMSKQTKIVFQALFQAGNKLGRQTSSVQATRKYLLLQWICGTVINNAQ